MAKLPRAAIRFFLLQRATVANENEQFQAIKDLRVLDNYEVLTKFDALSELTPSIAQEQDAGESAKEPGGDHRPSVRWRSVVDVSAQFHFRRWSLPHVGVGSGGAGSAGAQWREFPRFQLAARQERSRTLETILIPMQSRTMARSCQTSSAAKSSWHGWLTCKVDREFARRCPLNSRNASSQNNRAFPESCAHCARPKSARTSKIGTSYRLLNVTTTRAFATGNRFSSDMTPEQRVSICGDTLLAKMAGRCRKNAGN